MSTYLLLTLLLTGHVLCDFYFQSRECVENKKIQRNINFAFLKAHLHHALIHATTLTATVAIWLYANSETSSLTQIVTKNLNLLLIIFEAVFFSHIIIDMLKELFSRKNQPYRSLIFLADQLLHVSVIFWLTLIFFYAKEDPNQNAAIHTELLTAAIFLLSLLILLRPSSIFITLFMSSKKIGGVSRKIQITKSFLAEAYYSELAKNYSSSLTEPDLASALSKSRTKAETLVKLLEGKNLEIDSKSAFDSNGAGKWIGYIERLMLFVFYIFSQPAGIAIVMAIKTAFRFNDLKDDNDSARSEYIMIGTFLSFFITMIVAAIAKFSIESIWSGSQIDTMDFNILRWLNTYILGS